MSNPNNPNSNPQQPGSGASAPDWIQAVTAILGVLISILTSSYVTNLVNQKTIGDLREDLDTLPKEIEVLKDKKERLESEKTRLESDIANLEDNLDRAIEELQKPAVIDISDIQRPVELNVDLALRSRRCGDDVEIKLSQILFQKNSRMEWIFSIKNNTSVVQEFYIRGINTMTVIDSFGKAYPRRYTDSVEQVNPNGNVEKRVHFDLPQKAVSKFDVTFGSAGCLSVAPFSVQIPLEIWQSTQ